MIRQRLRLRQDMQVDLNLGKSREDIFMAYQGQGLSDMDLAREIASLCGRQQRRDCQLPNWLLIGVVAGMATWLSISVALLLPDGVHPYLPVALSVLGIASLVYIAAFSAFLCKAYTSSVGFTMGCLAHLAVAAFHTPIIGIVGIPLALGWCLLALMLKRGLFPHMGLFDIRRAESGAFILE
ncbi:hypothetical protein C8D92_10143 [Tamilnaduibacter salinus]|uniref:Uncharacterized protein n=1 Tax=Tamilnaduibacter salinus TaxID=1484056 RepID=A0A2A2I320_9GAMM|nr:hypothetical protein [Tamilnaduibacter salinus]PAV26027.1 hypothetical protein CF392_07920 [Tamilnaduibacter salinus]PVY78840.1 hypothetical protein C8D92_10143 [Tamilnaduibacter salinus]